LKIDNFLTMSSQEAKKTQNNKDITIRGAQEMVDDWIKTIGVSYFSELSQLAQLVEEVGEVARVISRTYGDQSFKKSDEGKKLADELADVLFTLICMANSTGVDLTEALNKNLAKKTKRDKKRHAENIKLRKEPYMDFKEIVEAIAQAGKQKKILRIYYPQTLNSRAGWRAVEPYFLANDTGEAAEHLVYGEDRLSPGHIFNGYTVESGDNHYDSFILGKIKAAKITNKQFKPRFGWKVEF